MFPTPDKLAQAMGASRARADKWHEPLAAACQAFGITTPARLAAFLAQIGHESASFGLTVESTVYTAKRIREMAAASRPGSRWRSLGPRAEDLAGNAIKMAEAVYGGRMGNAPEGSGDGYKYRGKGPMQITGRDNYEAMTDLIRTKRPDCPDFVINPDAILEPEWGAMTAAAFWHSRGLNELADSGSFDEITRRINGGNNGQTDRRNRYKAAREALLG